MASRRETAGCEKARVGMKAETAGCEKAGAGMQAETDGCGSEEKLCWKNLKRTG